MKENQKCDVLIIGAGPAGASLAYYLAREGIKTILIEKKSEVDKPVRCAEYVPAGISRLFDMPIPGIELTTEAMTTYIDYTEINTIKVPGLMLDRKMFIRSIVDSYLKKGGLLLKCTKAASFKKDNGLIKTSVVREGDKKYITSHIVAGADGPNSLVGKYIGFVNKRFVIGLNENIPLEAKDKSLTMIFFSPDIPGGYGWLFPKKKSINLGIGCEAPRDRVVPDLDFKRIYKAFKRKILSMDLIKTGSSGSGAPPGKMTTGLIPSSGMLESTVKSGFILAGDAAGLSNPVTGAGIYNAVCSANIAFKKIREALGKKDISFLNGIEKEYNSTFHLSLFRAAARKDEMLFRWPIGIRSTDDFENLIRDCWISFKSYWKR